MPQRKSVRKASAEECEKKSDKKLKVDHFEIEKAADKNGSTVKNENGADSENNPSVIGSEDRKKENSKDNGDKVKESEATNENNGSGDQLPASDSDCKEDDSGSDSTNTNIKNSNNHESKSAVSASSDAVKDEEKATDDESGVLLICGGTNWDLVGRKELPKSCKASAQQGRNLWGPHVWKEDIRIREIVSSCTACHSVIITEDGKALTFGRNDKGQLGVGDLNTRYEPVVVEALKNIKMKSAATGKGHTLFLTEDGIVYAAGDNKMGQLGVGSQSSNVLTPTKISYSGKPITKVACGAEFSLIVDTAGNLYSFGSPEYGQLGHNSEGKYFTTGNKISYHCETSPRKVVVFIEKTREGHVLPVEHVQITEVACGVNHALAVDTKNRLYTWGFAGYGRLGHNETKDELVPRNLKLFDYANRGVKKIWAGACFSLALDVNGVLYFWGQTKSSGEATMYPKPIQDLCNWNIRSVGCANKSIVVAADESVISWGPSPTYGELGYGENKAKSSTTPQEVKILEKIHIKKVTCGYGHTLMIADPKNVGKLPQWP